MTFDIKTLYGFRPPRYQCQKCFALFTDHSAFIRETRAFCPICKVEYLPTRVFEVWAIGSYLRNFGLTLEYEDLLGHCVRLADATQLLGKNTFDRPPISALYAALSRAQHFVHFMTYGISHALIGALKIVAQRVQVRGVVSGVSGDTASELTEFSNEAPLGHFDVKVCGPRSGPHDVPHQKILVIDGLLAFKGSANLTVSAWRSAAQGLDIVEAVTRVEEVIELHNRYFAPVWAGFSTEGETITMNPF